MVNIHQKIIVNRWISELREMGFTPEEMEKVFIKARELMNRKKCSHINYREQKDSCVRGPVEYKVCIDCGLDFDFKIIR